MLRRAALAGAVILSVSCNRSEGGDIGPLASGSGSAKTGSGGGFSADLAKELGAGSAGGSAAGSDGKSAAAGSDAKSAGAAAGSDAKPAAASGDAKPAGAATGDAKPAAAASGDAKPVVAAAGDVKPGAKPEPSAKPAKPEPSAAASPPAPHVPVKPSAELAAIKLSLLPNWDRDVDEAGTFQYVVRIKGTQSTKTFAFHYGYDDPRAPVDRDQYKKYLQDTKALTGEIRDRQRGAAWFLEANDGDGQPAFRYIVLYGGKRLICYGSLYKDADSNRLGDDRDQTVIQAKQICETLAL